MSGGGFITHLFHRQGNRVGRLSWLPRAMRPVKAVIVRTVAPRPRPAPSTAPAASFLIAVSVLFKEIIRRSTGFRVMHLGCVGMGVNVLQMSVVLRLGEPALH